MQVENHQIGAGRVVERQEVDRLLAVRRRNRRRSPRSRAGPAACPARRGRPRPEARFSSPSTPTLSQNVASGSRVIKGHRHGNLSDPEPSLMSLAAPDTRSCARSPTAARPRSSSPSSTARRGSRRPSCSSASSRRSTPTRSSATCCVDEAHVAMSLNHSNIVQVLDLGEAEGRYFLALELVDGWTLDRILRRSKAAGVPFPPALALYVTAEVCRALAYAHGKKRPDGKPLGIVHRDVSPHNVLVSEQGEVKLTDFGIAKAQTTTREERRQPHQGEDRLHVAGAGGRRRARRALRPVLRRHDALRDDHAAPSLRRADRLRDADAGQERRLPAARDRAPRPQPRALSGHSQGDGARRPTIATRRRKRCWSTSSR